MGFLSNLLKSSYTHRLFGLAAFIVALINPASQPSNVQATTVAISGFALAVYEAAEKVSNIFGQKPPTPPSLSPEVLTALTDLTSALQKATGTQKSS
jgi:hypothetical protein